MLNSVLRIVSSVVFFLLPLSPAWATLANQTPDLTRVGGAVDLELGYAATDAGDLNGDGYRDLAISAFGYSNGSGQSNEGGVLVHFGSATGLSATPNLTLEMNQGGARFGASVAGGNDLNGDGFDDLLVGAPLWDQSTSVDTGRAFVFLGGASMDATADANYGIQQGNAQFAASVASVGDVNGDGFGDWLVGAGLFDNGQTNNGSAFLYFGGATLDTTADATLLSAQAGVEFGTSVAGVGDVNGDGFADILIGALKYTNGQTSEGAAFLYLGGAGAFNTGTDLQLEGGLSNSQFGRTVQGVGDVNGDGFADFAVHATEALTVNAFKGRVAVYHGAATLDSTADFNLMNPLTSLSDFGQSLRAGDVNGDGYSDLLIGAPRYTDVATEEGRLLVHLGSATGLVAAPYQAFARGIADERFASAIAVADFNRDGFEDVLVGAPRFGGGTSNQGAMLLYRGGVTPGNSLQDVTAGSTQVGAQMGYSVATGDLNGDGFADVATGQYSYDLNAQTISSGRVSIFYGQPGGFDAVPDAELDGVVAEARFGTSIAIGDCNGDGYGDLIVGAPLHSAVANSAGAAFVYLGGQGAFNTQADLVIEGTQALAALGQAVAALGDLNGDGFGDFAIGAPTHDTSLSNAGQVRVFLGGSTLDAQADLLIDGPAADANAGRAIDGVGDMNGDGFADFAVGAPNFDVGSATDAGRVDVYLGGASLNNVADLTILGNGNTSRWGSAVSDAGDANGDGYADLVIGAPSFGLGRARIYFGQATLSTANGTDLVQAPDGAMGFSLASGDFNSDGYSDVLVGSPGNSSGGAALYLGGAGSFDAIADLSVGANQMVSRQGQGVGMGDVNGDGTADLLIGAPNLDTSVGTDAGGVLVHLGNGRGRAQAVQQFADGGIVPVYSHGRTGVSATIAMDSYSVKGVERTRLEVEFCPQSRPFGHLDCQRQVSSAWNALPANGNGLLLSATLTGFADLNTYQWRARTWYAPITITAAGITAPTQASWVSPWRRQLGRSDSMDFRGEDRLFKDSFE